MDKTTNERKRAGALKRFASEKKGVAAIEFAFIAPLLICLYLGSMEIGQAIDAHRKVTRISAMVADLVTQENSVTRDQLKSIMEVGQSVIKPHGRSDLTIKVTAIEMNGDSPPQATEIWWRELKGDGSTRGGRPTNQLVSREVPPTLLKPNSSLIRVETGTDYKWVLTYSESSAGLFGASGFWNGLNMNETSYAAARISRIGVPCLDC